MVTQLPPPVPPQVVFSAQEQIATLEQMFKSLEETAKYQESALAYHQQSLELLQQEALNTKAQLELGRQLMESLSQTEAGAPSKSKSRKTKAPSPTKTKAKTAQPKQSRRNKPKNQAQQKSASSKAASLSEGQTSKKPTLVQTQVGKGLPDSPVLKKFETITAMVWDYVQKQEGVVEVTDIMKYAYPNGLSQPWRRKVYNSFNYALGRGCKKGLLQRSEPGKYRSLSQ